MGPECSNRGQVRRAMFHLHRRAFVGQLAGVLGLSEAGGQLANAGGKHSRKERRISRQPMISVVVSGLIEMILNIAHQADRTAVDVR